MFEVIGNHTKATVYADTFEQEMVNQLYGICNHPIFDGSRISIMPDCHSGKGCVVGFTAELPKN